MYIDIRSKNKYLLGHINDAINIDYYELLFNYEKYLQKDIFIVIMETKVRFWLIV